MPFHELTPMHHLVAFGPIPKTLVSFRPHAFRLRWERFKQRSRLAQTKSDPSCSFHRPVTAGFDFGWCERALAPADVAEVVTVAVKPKQSCDPRLSGDHPTLGLAAR